VNGDSTLGGIVLGTSDADRKCGSFATRTCQPRTVRCADGPASRERTQSAARPNAPAQTRDLAEQRAAWINAMKNTNDAMRDKGQGQAGTGRLGRRNKRDGARRRRREREGDNEGNGFEENRREEYDATAVTARDGWRSTNARYWRSFFARSQAVP
jgi:hypothetical protein